MTQTLLEVLAALASSRVDTPESQVAQVSYVQAILERGAPTGEYFEAPYTITGSQWSGWGHLLAHVIAEFAGVAVFWKRVSYESRPGLASSSGRQHRYIVNFVGEKTDSVEALIRWTNCYNYLRSEADAAASWYVRELIGAYGSLSRSAASKSRSNAYVTFATYATFGIRDQLDALPVEVKKQANLEGIAAYLRTRFALLPKLAVWTYWNFESIRQEAYSLGKSLNLSSIPKVY